MQPSNEQTAAATTQDVQFNEKNTSTITWDQLPENLKNAEMINAETGTGKTNRTAASYLTSVGPWGGGGGNSFSIYPLSSSDKIYAIGIRSKDFVDALSVWYIRTNGTIYAYNVGGTGGDFHLQAFGPTERITAIAGRSATYLDRLTVYTTAKTFSYGGNGGGTFYSGTQQGGQILGFFGGAKVYVDRVGAYFYSL